MKAAFTLMVFVSSWSTSSSLAGVVTNDDQREKSPSIEDLCSLPSLSADGFVSGKTAVYWNICPQTSSFPPEFCTDSSANVCMVNIDESGKRSQWIPNAGTLNKDSKLVKEASGHYSLEMDNGQKCGDNDVYSTRFDFFCNDGEAEKDPQQSIFMPGHSKACNFTLFWYTSLACSELLNEERPSQGCLLYVPLFDQMLDLNALQSPTSYYPVKSGKCLCLELDSQFISFVFSATKKFQVNLCSEITNGSCKGYPVCEVDEKGSQKRTVIPKEFDTTTWFDESSKAVLIKYSAKDESSVADIKLECDETAQDPQISYEMSLLGREGAPDEHHFKVKTKNVCLHPTISCDVVDPKSGSVYDLTSLKTSSETWMTVKDSRVFYLAVCKTLSPSQTAMDCPGSRTSACSHDTSLGQVTNIGNLGSSPVLLPQDDNALMIKYTGGDACNSKQNMSTAITFRCDPIEKGPRFEHATNCVYAFEWLTPSACPQTKTISKSCKIRDPVLGHEFNLNPLRNDSSDYVSRGFSVNVCGGLTSKSAADKVAAISRKNGAVVVGKESSKTFEYQDGKLTMKFSGQTCKDGVNYTSKINFLCDHRIQTGGPVLSTQTDCDFEFTWHTVQACSPFEEVECKTTDGNGTVYDLSELSMSRQNYNLRFNDSTRFMINVCRSLVSTQSTSKCPYQAAACLGSKEGSKWAYLGIGQVRDGPKFLPDEGLVLEYPMGTICKDPKSERPHETTKIVFGCDEKLLQSEPEFVKREDCTSIFTWDHRAACGISNKTVQGRSGCEVTHPATGHTYDLSSLESEPLEFSDANGRYQVGICKSLKRHTSGKLCGSTSGACMIARAAKKALSLGQVNDHLLLSSRDELQLEYKGGDKCGDGTFSTVLTFRCAPIRKHPAVFVDPSSGDCQYFVNVFTSLACDRSVSCLVPNTNIDLASLIDYESNARYYDSGKTTFISVCKPLKNVEHLNCPPNSAICSAKGSPKYVNEIGYGHPPIASQAGTVQAVTSWITSTDQSVAKPTTLPRSSSRVTGTFFLVNPRSTSPSRRNVTKFFSWPTLVACENATTAVAKNRLLFPSCIRFS